MKRASVWGGYDAQSGEVAHKVSFWYLGAVKLKRDFVTGTMPLFLRVG